ncbi:MAG: hypothetical protein JHD23_08770 [Akkermansiaceae bacterium]|nr:hypothetical protein [Akkermansiaceae bacterium]
MKPPITDAVLDELLKNYSQPGHLLGPDDLLTELKKRFINRILDSELIPQSKAHRRKALEKKPPHSA